MADLETNMRIDYKYSALTLNEYIQIQHELTFLPKSEIKKVLTISDYEIPLSIINSISYEDIISDKRKYRKSRVNQDELIADLMNTDLLMKEIAEKYKIDEKSLRNKVSRLKESGVEIPERKRKNSFYLYPEIVEMRAKGIGNFEIARILKISYSSVKRIIKECSKEVQCG